MPNSLGLFALFLCPFEHRPSAERNYSFLMYEISRLNGKSHTSFPLIQNPKRFSIKLVRHKLPETFLKASEKVLETLGLAR
jgi:hypothetical protein